MSNNTQLPAEEKITQLFKRIITQATHQNNTSGIDRTQAIIRIAELGVEAATEYATRLQEFKQEFDHEMQKNYETIAAERAALNDAKALLELVRIKHEAGLLPDRFVYDKIKKFLYGE